MNPLERLWDELTEAARVEFDASRDALDREPRALDLSAYHAGKADGFSAASVMLSRTLAQLRESGEQLGLF